MNKKILTIAASGLALGAALASEANVASAFSGTGVTQGQQASWSEFASPYATRLRAQVSAFGSQARVDVIASSSGWYESALYWTCPGQQTQVTASGLRYNTTTAADITRYCVGNVVDAAGTLNDQNGQPLY